jgi:hypothetical protein
MLENIEMNESDNRRFLRINYETELICKIVNENDNTCIENKSDEDSIKINALNISLGGVSGICKQEIQIGTCVQFTLKIEESHHLVTTQVIYCAQLDDNYKIGMEFINPRPVLLERIKRLTMKK